MIKDKKTRLRLTKCKKNIIYSGLKKKFLGMPI